MGIYERLRLACKEKGLNIKEFAETTGMPYRTAQSYLSGDREPNADGMTIICTRLRVNINWLLTGEGEHFIQDYQASENMDENELAMLSVYRNCNEVGKRIILRSVVSFKDVPELNDKNLISNPLTQI